MTPQQKNTARRWKQEGYTIAKIADRLGVSLEEVRAALRSASRTASAAKMTMQDHANELRLAGYSEAVIVANFGRDV